MLYSEKIKQAVEIAFEAHAGQLDMGGYPYIMHPLHIAEQMSTEDKVILALLHDVIEDDKSGMSILKILEMELSEEVMEALDILTRKPKQTYKDYTQTIKSNELARQIKIEDLKHNIDITRRIMETSTTEEEYIHNLTLCSTLTLRYVNALEELTKTI